MNASDKKIVVFYVLEILRAYSDSNHFMTYKEIVDKIENRYNVKPDVKAIASNINTLISAGFEIVKCGHNGCYLSYRDFDSGELMYLVDAINSSKAIPAKQAKDLIERLTKNCSVYDKKKYNLVHKADIQFSFNNKELFYIIELLGEAIDQKKKISFNYNEYKPTKELKQRNEGKEFIINPYFLVNSRGKYYLVCNYDKYDNVSNYKVECISNVKILDEPIKDIKTLNDMQHFSTKDYINEHIYMTNGNSVTASLKLSEARYVNDIIDWYGDKIRIRETKEGIFVDLTVNEQALAYWSLQYGEHIEVVSPKETREKIKAFAKTILNKYKE